MDRRTSIRREYHAALFRRGCDAAGSRSRAAGTRIDATTAHKAGLAYASDEEQLEYAGKEGRVLFSYNVSDFFRIHTETLSKGATHSGIILAPQQQYGIGERIRRILKLISARSAEDMQNRVEFLSDWD